MEKLGYKAEDVLRAHPSALYFIPLIEDGGFLKELNEASSSELNGGAVQYMMGDSHDIKDRAKLVIMVHRAAGILPLPEGDDGADLDRFR